MAIEPGSVKKGDKVHYQPEYFGSNEFENGIVKEVPEHTDEAVRVVYNCNGEWDRIDDYTSAMTSIYDLKHGWR